MNTSSATADELTNELERALDDASTGKRDREDMRKAIDEMNRSREETRQNVGTVDVAVDLIRDARDQ